MKIKPFRIVVKKESRARDARYIAIARTVAGDRTAYGATHQQAINNVLPAAWTASTIH